jgi:uncharacterized protein (TIGR03118 family)
MSRLMTSARALAVAAGLFAPAALAAPVPLSDAQLGAAAAGIRFSITNRVSDLPGVAPVQDDKLVNAWGLSQGPSTALWVANNGSDTSTIYDPSSFAKAPLTVNVPGAPTGTTFVGIADAFKLGPSMPNKPTNTLFAFATEGGQIEGWNPNVNQLNAVIKVDESAQGSEFKGLTLGMKGQKPLLFAADFGHGVISAYDTHFNKVRTFTDPTLPANYTPFNVQNLNGLLYVTFAKREPGATDETAGKGLGFVDVFDTSGHLVRRLVSHSALNAPWGLAIAPQSFGRFAGALLVGNFGDGQINAYDPVTGRFLGRVHDWTGKAGIDGLWALRSGPNGTITFSAGPQDESHGLIGSIAPMHRMWGGDEMATLAEMHH